MKIPVRWTILLGSFVAYMFDALEIVILSLALPAMRADLGLTVVQGGLLATATLLGIGASAVTTGRLADRHGRRRALLVSLGVFGVCTVLVAIAPSFEAILVLRLVSGLGLGGVWAIVVTYVVEAWPAEQRGRAVAFVISAFPVGGLLAALVAGLLGPDWRMMFLVCGVGAIIPLVLVWRIFPESQEWVESASARQDVAAAPAYRVRDLFGRDLLRVTVVGTAVCSVALLGFWGANTWLPTLLVEERGISSGAVAVLISVLNIGMFLGYNVFGLITDKIGRLRALILSLVISGLLLPLYAWVTNEYLLLALGPAFAFFAVFTAMLGTYLGELYPTELRATGAGFCFNVGRGISALAPVLLGFLAGATGLGVGFVVCGVLFLAAAALVLALPRSASPSADPVQEEPAR